MIDEPLKTEASPARDVRTLGALPGECAVERWILKVRSSSQKRHLARRTSFLAVFSAFFLHPSGPLFAQGTLPGASASTKSAGCWVLGSHPDGGLRLLLVKDVWSQRWSLPGGGAEPSESLLQAAHRELLEETNLKVVSRPVEVSALLTFKRFSVFRCSVEGATPVKPYLSPEVPPRTWSLTPPTWSSSGNQREISDRAWVDPEQLPEKYWRFPSQRASILAQFEMDKRAHAGAGENGLGVSALQVISDKNPLGDTTIPNPAIFTPWIKGEGLAKSIGNWGVDRIYRDAMVIARFQAASDSIVPAALWKILSALGEIPFFIWALALLGMRWGTDRLIILFLSLLASAWINELLKAGFALPRPYELVPQVQRFSAHGFGFPSGHTQVATTFWTLMASLLVSEGHKRVARKWRIPSVAGACALLALGTGLSRVYGGVHSFLDVTGGWVLGVIIGILFYHLGTRQVLESRWFAATFFVGSLLGLMVAFVPSRLMVAATLLGYLLGCKIERRWGFWRTKLRKIPTQWQSVALSGASGASIFGVFALGKYMIPVERTFLAVCGVQSTTYLGLGLIVGILWSAPKGAPHASQNNDTTA